MEPGDRKLLEKLQIICAKKEYCTGDVMTKALKLTEGEASRAEEIVAKLVEDGYVSNPRYASAFARDKAHLSGWGPVKISYQLRLKGISKEDIDAALCGVDGEKASGKLKKALEARAKALEGDPQQRLKLIRFALSRGYEYDSVRKLLSELEVRE